MKKLIMVIICIISLLFATGVAYASQTLNVNSSETVGSSSLNISVVEANPICSSAGIIFSDKDVQITKNSKAVTVNINGLYPGAKAEFEVLIKNTGTLPICLNQVVQNFGDVIDTKTGENLGENASITKYIIISCDADILDKNNCKIQAITNINTTSATNMKIGPGQSIRLNITVKLDYNAGNNTMNKKFNFTISPVFIQS